MKSQYKQCKSDRIIRNFNVSDTVAFRVMDAVSKQMASDLDKDLVPLHESTDAVRWAKEFMQTIRSPHVPFELDEGMMISWFANAMCAQMDFDHRRQAKADAEREVYVLINGQTSELIAVYSKLPCKSICDRDYSLFLGKDLEMIDGTDIPTAGQGSNWNCILYKAKVDSLNRVMQHCTIEYQTDK